MKKRMILANGLAKPGNASDELLSKILVHYNEWLTRILFIHDERILDIKKQLRNKGKTYFNLVDSLPGSQKDRLLAAGIPKEIVEHEYNVLKKSYVGEFSLSKAVEILAMVEIKKQNLFSSSTAYKDRWVPALSLEYSILSKWIPVKNQPTWNALSNDLKKRGPAGYDLIKALKEIGVTVSYEDIEIETIEVSYEDIEIETIEVDWK